MKRIAAALSLVACSVAPAAAQPLLCFGTEPFWGIDLTVPDRARMTSPDSAPVDFAGHARLNAVLRERIWRGRAAGGTRDLVVFLREAACSDGMSDTTHPISARASTPDGAFLVGCCRVPSAQAGVTGTQATPFEGTTWRLVSMPEQPADAIAALARPITIRFESGRVSGYSGCNTFTGPYTLETNRVTFGALAATRMACMGAGGRLEGPFHAALRAPVTFAIDGDRMTLSTDAGTVLAFETQPPADGR
jgi:heat shock protein HslJ